eukprot:scaffold27646_cov19-Tisochrysis_lutea.AAC.3
MFKTGFRKGHGLLYVSKEEKQAAGTSCIHGCRLTKATLAVQFRAVVMHACSELCPCVFRYQALLSALKEGCSICLAS